MELVLVLLPLSLVIAGIGVVAFIWAVRKGQFDDLETPAVRILFDDESSPGASPESSERVVSPGDVAGADAGVTQPADRGSEEQSEER